MMYKRMRIFMVSVTRRDLKVFPLFFPDSITLSFLFQFVQKKDPSYVQLKEDTVWTMKKLNQYINEVVMADKFLKPDWVYDTLTVK